MLIVVSFIVVVKVGCIEKLVGEINFNLIKVPCINLIKVPCLKI